MQDNNLLEILDSKFVSVVTSFLSLLKVIIDERVLPTFFHYINGSIAEHIQKEDGTRFIYQLQW
jgi:hypothetical protein